MEGHQWIELKSGAEKIKHRSKLNGVDVTFYVSPYDVPEAVRGFYNEKKEQFIIEFKYLGEEGLEKRVMDQYVTLRVGKNSKRLYVIEIDVKGLRARQFSNVSVKVTFKDEVQEEIEQALTGLLQKPPSTLRRENYKLAKDALQSKRHELFAAIA